MLGYGVQMRTLAAMQNVNNMGSFLPLAAAAHPNGAKVWRSRSPLRDGADVRFLVFADAVSLRACGMFIAALQITSPMRPFNLALLRQIQTALSLHGVRTIDARGEV